MAVMMATHITDPVERTGRRRPFSSWMKKLANLKPSSSTAVDNHQNTTKRNTHTNKMAVKKPLTCTDNNCNLSPVRDVASFVQVYPQRSSSTLLSATSSISSLSCSGSDQSSDEEITPTVENKSIAATSTGRANSVQAPSNAPSSGQGTNGTSGNLRRGNDSTFSSPAPSVRSLTTTLTTLHSATPIASNNHIGSNHITIQFSHQFPSSSPLNAIPPYLVPQSSGGHPSTYNTATANNLLTDNASILTLASSSKRRRRRRSMDTDASVRALAPSSLFGGSRESLPLSILSANIDTNSYQARPSIGALNERGSIYSVAGVNTTLASERNSYYAGKQPIALDAGSIKSGFAGHNLSDSIGGSIGTNLIPSSPLTSPREYVVPRTEDLSQSETNCNIKEDEVDENSKSQDTGIKNKDLENTLNVSETAR
ncbi:unnamed protein product [Blumeria hordei]|uniref:Uncharacterized protein n=1 Tax=Blumeria hordei TaxID=2867405 RepID=A0A383UP44_BLUHO|nr:unnamed protein product [Blumeria hordei]